MARIKIVCPSPFFFSMILPVRITDLNYGGHVGNDAFLSLIHEARMQYLKHYGYTELEFAGIGLIMQDAGIEFKGELFYGDAVSISVAAAEFSQLSFEIYYKLEAFRPGQENKAIPVAVAKTRMVGYDYKTKKAVSLPEEAMTRLGSGVRS